MAFEEKSILGEPIDRVDGRLKVMGRATYAYEHVLTDALIGVLLTSNVAKGRIVAIDTSAAESYPGVVLVMTHVNSPKYPELMNQKASPPAGRIVQALQHDVIHYANQPVAVVVADTFVNAHEATQLIRVRYAVEPHAVSMEGRETQGFTPEKVGGANSPGASHRGDVASGLAQAAHRLDAVYSTPFEVHNPMEPHATIAVWDTPESLILFDATQGVFTDRDRVAHLLGLKPESVRIISPYLGGGFGSKGPTWSHVIITALAAKRVGKPVKLAVTRPQMFGMLGYRSETKQLVRAGVGLDGRLSALQFDTTCLTSNFETYVETASLPARMLYSVPNNATTHKVIKGDVGTPSYMRAPGEAPGTYGLEVAMDELAYLAKMDPIEFRLKNYAETDEEEKKPWSSKSLRECYRRGAERFGWDKRNPAPRSMRNGNMLIGMGMATAEYPTRRSPSSASAAFDADGLLHVDAGTQDLGTGTYTIMTQVAAATFGVDPSRVRFRLGDTKFPKTPVSGGSQTAASTGSAVYAAVEALQEKISATAVNDPQSPLSGVSMQDVGFANGRIFSKSNPSESEDVIALVKRYGQPIESKAEAKPGEEKEKYSMYAFGAQFAEVHVDADLGQMRVARMVGCFGAGKILNAKTARNQLMGGMAWGVSMALYEHAVMDRRVGRWVNNNLAEYHVPTNLDIGEMEAIWVDEHDEHVNPLGAKGIGEIGITGASAAVANAIYHATGKRVRDLPITLDKLL